MHGFRGAGRAKFALYDDNTGLLINKWYPFGNQQTLVITEEADTIQVLSTDHENNGVSIDSMEDAKPANIKLSSNTFDNRTLAIAFMGESAAKAISETTITDEDVVAVLGGSARLAQGAATAVVVQDETDTTTYVEGDDYTVETGPGFTLLTFPKTSSITDAATLHVGYTSGADTGYKITGGTKPSKKIAILFDGRNQFTKEEVLIDIFEGTIKPAGGFDVMSKDPAVQEYEVSPVQRADKDSTYHVHVKS